MRSLLGFVLFWFGVFCQNFFLVCLGPWFPGDVHRGLSLYRASPPCTGTRIAVLPGLSGGSYNLNSHCLSSDPQSPRVIDALPEHASDRCRLRLVIGAVSVCLKRGTELGDGVDIR